MNRRKKAIYKQPALEHQSDDSIAFYIACSNHEILQGVEQILRKHGIMGVTDMSGNINYFIDGRWGSQLASRRVLELTDFIRERKSKMSRNLLLEATIVVDECLDTLLFRQHLRGFVFLRQILIAIYLDGGLMTPLSKTVFPEVATIFNCSVSHVERNVRYLFDKLGEDESYIRSILDTNAELPDYVYQESENREKRLLFKQDTAYSIRTCLSRLSSLMKTHALTYHEGKKENDELDQNELKVADDNEEWEK